ncbi:MAG: Gfo/Idh/MocA family protein [Culicoidibacterales bacterium]
MLNIGIIGTGVIATQFASEAQKNPRVKLVGVCARNLEKTKKFAAQFGIEHVYERVEQLCESKQIDAIYIASLHPTHPQYAISALNRQKHVLCEKPAALTVTQIEQIKRAATSNQKLFMEAMTVGFHPLYQQIKQVIASGKIGEITHVETSLGRKSQKEHKHAPELAGGCVYDIGIYNIFCTLDLLGEIKSLTTLKQMHQIWDVVGTIQVLAEHKSGQHSYMYMTMDSISANSATIIGTKGTIQIPQSWTTPETYTITLLDGSVETITRPNTSWLGHELEAFVDTIEAGKHACPTMPLEMSKQIQQTIAQIYESAELVLPQSAILI